MMIHAIQNMELSLTKSLIGCIHTRTYKTVSGRM